MKPCLPLSRPRSALRKPTALCEASVERRAADTRRRYTPEEKIRIVLEGFRREATAPDPCRKEGINPANYYSWTREFMEAGKERLTRNTVGDATRQEIEQLKRENGDLKEIVADLVIETHRLKKTAIPPLNHGTAGRT